MNKVFIRSIARKVRAWVEQESDLSDDPAPDLMGWCAIASAQLSRELTQEGIPNVIALHEGYDGGHVFNMVEDHVLDVTATQFSQLRNTPVVFIHEKEAQQYRFYEVVEIFREVKDLLKYQRKAGWPANQLAYNRFVKIRT